MSAIDDLLAVLGGTPAGLAASGAAGAATGAVRGVVGAATGAVTGAANLVSSAASIWGGGSAGGSAAPASPGAAGAAGAFGLAEDGADDEFSALAPALRKVLPVAQQDPESNAWVRVYAERQGLPLEWVTSPAMLVAACVAQGVCPPPDQMTVGPSILEVIKLSGFKRVAGLKVSATTRAINAAMRAVIYSRIGLVYYQRGSTTGSLRRSTTKRRAPARRYTRRRRY